MAPRIRSRSRGRGSGVHDACESRARGLSRMANSTDPLALSVHGTNPQNLIEKILRTKIYANLFWKEHCFKQQPPAPKPRDQARQCGR